MALRVANLTPYDAGEMNINFFKWRPILKGITTLHEVNTYWNLCDLADANEALDLVEDSENHYTNQSLKKARK